MYKSIIKFSRFFCLGIVFPVLCTSPSLAVDWSLWPTLTGSCNGSGDGTKVMEADGTGTDIGAWYHHGEVYARTYVVAVNVTESGGKVTGIEFCPRQFNAFTQRERDLVTNDNEATYFIIGNTDGNDKNNCVWLCAKGYGGSKCSVAAGSSDALKNPYTTSLPGLFDEISLQIYNDKSRVDKRITAVSATPISTEKCSNSAKQPAINIYAVTQWLDHGAKVAAVSMHAKISGSHYTKNASDTKKTYVRAAWNSDEKIVCSPGYAVNSTGTDCEPYCGATPSVCNYVSGSYGVWNSAYQYTMNKCTCSCGTECKWSVSVESSRCNSGYYGNVTLGYNGSALYVASGSCTRCPSYGTNQYGTSSEGATKITQCYRSAQSGTKCDDIGCYTETGTCYYEQ